MQRMLSSMSSATMLAGLIALSIGVGCDKTPEEVKPKAKGATSTTGAAKSPDANGDDFVAGSKAEFFTTALAADPETFDTAKMSGAPEGRLAFNLFEGLLMPGPKTKDLKDAKELVVPGVAESYSVSEDGKTYTFKLRADAKWSNGDALTSEDFVYSWKRILTPDFPADYVQLLWNIEGAQAYSEGKESDWGKVGIKAPDAQTLVVTLTAPTPYFPELVSFYTFFPVPKKAVEAHGDDWTKPENIITNGAYKLASYKPQQDVILEKSENYWDAGNVKLGKVRLRIISDLNTVVKAYQTGELHWTGTSLPVAQVSNLVMHPDYVRHALLGTYYYRVNVKDDGPLKDNRVRQALSMAIDRQQLVNQTMKGLYTEALAFVPNSMPGYESAFTISPNVMKAKKLLAEAGYSDEKPLKIKLLYNTDENHKLVAEAVQAMWKANLGVEVELVNKEWKTYLQDIDTLSYEVARAGWIGDYNDPMTFLDMWVSGNGNNDTGWSNPEYDNLIKQAQAEPSVRQRRNYLQEAEKLLLEQGPVIPIYFYTNNMLASRQLEGFHEHNRDIHLFKYMSLPEK